MPRIPKRSSARAIRPHSSHHVTACKFWEHHFSLRSFFTDKCSAAASRTLHNSSCLRVLSASKWPLLLPRSEFRTTGNFNFLAVRLLAESKLLRIMKEFYCQAVTYNNYVPVKFICRDSSLLIGLGRDVKESSNHRLIVYVDLYFNITHDSPN